MARLKAYEVRDSGEDHCCIRFATNSATARREGAQELDTDWESVESCKQAPYFDQFAPGRVPPMGLIAAGWWLPCTNCDRSISGGMAEELEAEDLDPIEFTPQQRGHAIYCCARCAAEAHAKCAARHATTAALLELFEAKFPAATVEHVHVYGERLERYIEGDGAKATVKFGFPGSKYGATYIYGAPFMHMAQCDVDAFHRTFPDGGRLPGAAA